MEKVRVNDAQFLAVVRAACHKRTSERVGTLKLSDENKELAKKILTSKNKSEG